MGMKPRRLHQEKVWFIEYHTEKGDIITDYFSHWAYEKALALLESAEEYVVIDCGPYRMPPIEDFEQWKSNMGFDDDDLVLHEETPL